MAKGKDRQAHIGIFGRINTGKSSLINILTGQDLAIVSPQPGTTTDPVKKSIEIPGIGPVVLIDTAGTADSTVLGEKRVKKTLFLIRTIDLAVLVIDLSGIGQAENELIEQFDKEGIPCLVVYNKEDLFPLQKELEDSLNKMAQDWCSFSCTTGDKKEQLIQKIRELIPPEAIWSANLIGDLIKAGDTVVLVTPIDEEAPEGRMILPQVQVIRDVLDHDGIAVVLKETELDVWMSKRSEDPALVITDSQAFAKVSKSVPDNIPLTSFSIALARQKGNFNAFIEGTSQLSKLQEKSKVLIMESCTHHVACNDIGREKIPRWIDNHTGLKHDYEVVVGLSDWPDKIENYDLVIQCGGCVMTQRQVRGRIQHAINAGVPVSNYGMVIAYVHGIFSRALKPFVDNIEDYL